MSEQPPSDSWPSTYRTMREFASDERPRERLLRHGPSVLSEAELVAIVLGSGLPGQNVLEVARRLLEGSVGLAGLIRADAAALQRTKGLGPARVAQLLAAVELGRRAGALDPDSRPLVDSPEAVNALLGGRMLGLTGEQLWVLSLDVRNRLLGATAASEGGIAAVGVRHADVFREPIVLRAASVIVAHNHPSGDPKPSPQDIAATRDIIDAGKLLDIQVLDHVIIGQGRFVSMKRDGYAFRRT